MENQTSGFYRWVAWVTMAAFLTQSLALFPRSARAQVAPASAQGESDGSHFAESTPTVAAANVRLTQANAMKVRAAPVSATGAFETAIAIDVPPGRAGLTPALQLSYSSDAFREDSPVGAGFQLRVPSIARSTSGGFPPLVRVGDGPERRYADEIERGSRLSNRILFTAPAGDLVPAAGAAVPQMAAGALAFVPQRETAAVRYEYVPSEDRWVEHLPSGRKRFYGASGGASGGGPKPARVVNELGTHRWLLVEESDAAGNTIQYAYHHAEPRSGDALLAAQARPVLREIVWGGNARLRAPAPFRLTTKRADYPNGKVDMLDGHVVLTSQITTIEVFGPDGQGRGQQLYWTYELALEPSADSGRPLLRSLTRVGADGSEALQWEFEYSGNQGKIEFEEAAPTGLPQGVYARAQQDSSLEDLNRRIFSNQSLTPLDKPLGYKLLDFDADGDVDILYHPAGLRTAAAKIVANQSFRATDRGGPFGLPGFERLGGINGNRLGYPLRLFAKALADVDGDSDLDAVAFRVTIQHQGVGDGRVVSRTDFNEPRDIAADVLCTEGGGLQDQLDAQGLRPSGSQACPDPLPPDLAPGSDEPFPDPLGFVEGLRPSVADFIADHFPHLTPFFDTEDPTGPLPLFGAPFQFGDLDNLLAMSFPPGSVGVLPPGSVDQLQQAALEGAKPPRVVVRTPAPLQPGGYTLAAAGTLDIGANVTLLAPAGGRTVVSNVGGGSTRFGPNAIAGAVWAEGPLRVDGARLEGLVHASSTFERVNGAVTGTVDDRPFAVGSTALEFLPRRSQGDVVVPSSGSVTLSPGSFGVLDASGASQVRLRPGEYSFTSVKLARNSDFILEQGGQPTSLFVRDEFASQGRFTNLRLSAGAGPQPFSQAPSGEPAGSNLLVAYAGNKAIQIDSRFAGTLVAPSAQIRLSAAGNEPLQGSFFARDVFVEPGTTVVHQPFDFARRPSLAAAPVDFRQAGLPELLQRPLEVSGSDDLLMVGPPGQSTAERLRRFRAGFESRASQNPQGARGPSALPRGLAVTPDTAKPSFTSEDTVAALGGVCNRVCNGAVMAQCGRTLEGNGSSWLQSTASVSEFGELPSLSNEAALGLLAQVASNPLFNGSQPGFNGCTRPVFEAVCAGWDQLCMDAQRCSGGGPTVPTTYDWVRVALHSPQGNARLNIAETKTVTVHGWSPFARQIVSLQQQCAGQGSPLEVRIERDFQAPLLDLDADGRADILLLKTMQRSAGELDYASVGQAFINRVGEGGGFIIDSARHGSATAFTESVGALLRSPTGDISACVPNGAGNPTDRDACSVARAIRRVDVLTMPVDYNGDRLPDLVVGKPLNSAVTARPGGLACRPGNQYYLNRGYRWGTAEAALPGLYSPGDGGHPLSLLRNRSRSCLPEGLGGGGGGFPPESMRFADLNADGRLDVVFALGDVAARQAPANKLFFANNGQNFERREVPSAIEIFARVAGSGSGFPVVVAADLQRLVDLDNDGLVDVLTEGERPGSTATWRRHRGVVPDLLTGIKQSTGSQTKVEYVAATSAAARRLGVIEIGGQLPAGKQVVSQVTRATRPLNSSWQGFGEHATAVTTLKYKRFTRESGSSKALGFERITESTQNRLPSGEELEQVTTTRVFDTRVRVPMSDGADPPILHPLRGHLREIITETGDTRLHEEQQYFLEQLAPGSVRIRPRVEEHELCESGECLTTGVVSDEFDEFGFARQVASGNVADGAVLLDVDRVEGHAEYEHRTGRWILGLPVQQQRFGYSENLEGQATFDQVLERVETQYNDVGLVDQVTRALLGAADGCGGAPEVSTQSFAYNAVSLPESVTENGRRTTTTKQYDPQQLYPKARSVRVLGADGRQGAELSEELAFDYRFGVQVLRTDANGHTAEKSLDARGRVTRTKGPLGLALEHNEYSDATDGSPNRVDTTVFVAEGKEHRVVRYLDGAGQLLAAVEETPDRESRHTLRSRTVYDALGRAVQQYQPRPASGLRDVGGPGVADSYVFDGLGRLVQSRQAGRQPATRVYGVAAGSAFVAETNPRGTTTTAVLNARGAKLLVELTGPRGEALGATEFVRDGLDRIVAISDADGSVRRLGYDLGGRVARTTLPHQPAAQAPPFLSCFDGDGELISRATPAGRQVHVERDNLGRIERAEYASGGVVRTHAFQYDAPSPRVAGLGRLTSFQDDSGDYALQYDAYGRVRATLFTPSEELAEGLPEGAGGTVRIVDTYSRVGALKRRTTSGLGVAPLQLDIDLDSKGAATAVYSTDSSSPSGRVLVESVEYDAFDRAAQVVLGSGVAIERTFYPVTQRLQRVAHGNLLTLEYPEYDENDNVIQEIRRRGSGAALFKTHRYDALDRLDESTLQHGQTRLTEAFGYSNAGNVELGPSGVHLYEDPSNSQAVTAVTGSEGDRFLSYDLDGFLESDSAQRAEGELNRELVFDAAGCLERVEAVETRSGSPSHRVVTEHLCNALGERVARDTFDEATGKRERVFFLPGDLDYRPDDERGGHLLQRVTIAGVAVAELAWSTETGEPLPSKTGYVHTDLRGSTLAKTGLLDPAARVVEEADYFAYGQTLSLTGRRAPERQFTGVEPDPLTGDYRFGVRTYDPTLARFFSPDPLALYSPQIFEGRLQQLNVYQYAANNPVMRVDPTGEIAPLVLAAAVVAVVKAVEVTLVVTTAVAASIGLHQAVNHTSDADQDNPKPPPPPGVPGSPDSVLNGDDEDPAPGVAGGEGTTGVRINGQKQAGHIPGTPQNKNRIKQGKPTSSFFGEKSGERLTQITHEKGKPVPGRPNVKEHDFGISTGTGPNGGSQTKVRVHQSPKTGEIHGHPSGPERH